MALRRENILLKDFLFNLAEDRPLARTRLACLLFLGALLYHVLLFFLSYYALAPDSQSYIKIAGLIKEGAWGKIPIDRPIFYPFLIYAFSFVTGNPELAGSLISIIFSSLLSVVVFYLARCLFDWKKSLIAALLAILYPWLTLYSFQVLTEATFITLVTVAILAGISAYLRPKTCYFSLAALFCGLAYLARNEGIAYGFLMLIWFAIFALYQKQYRNMKYAFGVSLFCAVFGILVMMYVWFLHWQTGHWLLSGRTYVLVKGLVSSEQYVSLKDQPSDTVSFFFSHLKPFLQKYLRNLRDAFQQGLPALVSPFFLILFSLGLFQRPWSKEDLIPRSYLLSFVFVPFLTTSVSHVNYRYYMPIIPIFLIFIAGGIEQLQIWLVNTLSQFQENRLRGLKRLMSSPNFTAGLVVVVLIPLSLNPVLRKSLGLLPIYEIEYKETGLWLRENTPREALILCQKGQVDYYARRQALGVRQPGKRTAKPLDEILTLARQSGRPCYLVVEERWKDRSPSLNFLLDEKQAPLFLRPVYVNNRHHQAKVVVYKIK